MSKFELLYVSQHIPFMVNVRDLYTSSFTTFCQCLNYYFHLYYSNNPVNAHIQYRERFDYRGSILEVNKYMTRHPKQSIQMLFGKMCFHTVLHMNYIHNFIHRAIPLLLIIIPVMIILIMVIRLYMSLLKDGKKKVID